WLAALLFLIVTAICFLNIRRKRLSGTVSRKNISLLLLLILLAAGLTHLSAGIEKNTAYNRNLAAKPLTSTGNLQVRTQAWSKTIKMIREYPLTGVGIGNWKIMLPKYGTLGMKSSSGAYHYVRPHNDFFWVAGELGLPGIIIYLCFFIYLLVSSVAILRKCRSGKDYLFFTFILAGLIAYLVIAFFSFPRERYFHTLLLMIYAALISSSFAQEKIKTSKFKTLINHLIVLFHLVILITIIVVGYHRLKAEIHLRNAISARRSNRHDLVIATINKIDNRFLNMSPSGTPINWYRGNAYTQIGYVYNAFIDYYIAAENHPYHIYILNNLGTSYELMGNHSQGKKYYNKVLDISPRFEETLTNLSAACYNAKDYIKAAEIIGRVNPRSRNPKFLFYRRKIEDKIRSLQEVDYEK
ncbi:MAG: O-antigen ligase family protein, partial [Candidatus Cloacimonetes bacterium]|nr:O-antigen ligase family protein [Candidatus Cloacimonadota bacterium]